ncbi:MAG: 2-C-methyl-D-erythritol 2,4-cyclodiphosphate synthase [Segetibacter sp.]|nr:2-C-methyl-D-erythritol 2,4-cyclodiphosphate synthase [Segetibacter sp.]
MAGAAKKYVPTNVLRPTSYFCHPSSVNYSINVYCSQIQRMFRIGSGIDFHQLVEGRELWLGGVLIPHTKGALGHSDADVLLHAICDALLGALCLGDIGVHFPDTSSEFKNIDSKILLRRTYELIENEGYKLVNADTTLCLERPKIKPFVESMQQVIAGILKVTIKDVSIKATTTEKMGFAGREEGLVAYATVLLQKRDF